MSHHMLEEVTGLGKTVAIRNKYNRVPFEVGEVVDEVSVSDREQNYFIQNQVLLDAMVIADEVDAQLMETVSSLMEARVAGPAA